ncbi:ABC transporter substrate-binding protein [Salinicola rhizosphaerae]|uniref:ABC transporter substrate-binding protein n=1 Tax=Salinicola rhizosphaerae TaxID=1443141 RepID=A0ABQ3DZ76_9GAMM|nr:ABC transporter substrate-binding protein [Salinicola rhizosphaerae]GHB19928.1 ABC transporter substrate-binding protein [Salinicola rhizosphaerae]
MTHDKLLLSAILIGSCGLAVGGVAQAQDGASTADKRVALSNNYAGNSWRQVMLQSFDETAKQAKARGIVAEADSYTTSENQATEQAAQIQNLILQGYDAIIIDAASPTALNGAVQEACDAGVTVVSFDGIVTAPCAWRIAVDFEEMGRQQVDYLASRLPDGGNLLEIRGLAGTSVDEQIHAGIEKRVEAHDDFRIAGSVHGDWAQEVAQKGVSGLLPSLPDIAGVVTQGGDGYGAAQAFEAAGRDMPIIVLGNRQDELQWWQEQYADHGYQTLSMSIAPGVASLAFWVTQQILAGKDVPKDLTVPFLKVTQETLDSVLEETPKGSVANTIYTQQDAQSVIADATTR